MARGSNVIRTEQENYIVSSVERTHIWLEVLHGEDKGIRVSIPLYSEEQSNDITEVIRSLEKRDVVSATLESSGELPRNWIVNSITKIN